MDQVVKKLFQSPSPRSVSKKPTVSHSGSMLTDFGDKEDTDSKVSSGKKRNVIIPKGAKLRFRPISDMDLEPKEAQTMAFLWNKLARSE